MPPRTQTKTIDDRLEAWANGIHKAIREDLHRMSKTLEEKIAEVRSLPERWIDRKLIEIARKQRSWLWVAGYTGVVVFVSLAGASIYRYHAQ